MQKAIETFLKSTGIISLVADCIAIYLFIQQLGFEKNELPSEKVISLGVVIILAFVLSISLIKFSGKASDGIFAIFGMVYAVFAAIILGLGSGSTMVRNEYIDWKLTFGYLLLGIAVTFFAHTVTKSTNFDTKWLGIPFIFVSIIQIAVILIALLSNKDVSFFYYVFLLIEIGIISLFFKDGLLDRVINQRFT